MDGEKYTMVRGFYRVALLVSDRANFKVRKVANDTEGHCIMMKGQFSKKTTVLTTYAPNDSVKRHEGQTVMGLQGTVNEAAITARRLQRLLSKMDIASGVGRQDRYPKETKNFENSAVRK